MLQGIMKMQGGGNLISNTVNSSAIIQCQCSLCAKTLQSIKDLIAHQKEHIMQGVEVTCPFRCCDSKFKIKSSFASHLSRHHRNPANRVVSSELLVHTNRSATNDSCTSSQFDGFVLEVDIVGEISNNYNLENSVTLQNTSELPNIMCLLALSKRSSRKCRQCK